MDNFDKDFNRMQKFLSWWFVFVTSLVCGLLSGFGVIVYKILVRFDVL